MTVTQSRCHLQHNTRNWTRRISYLLYSLAFLSSMVWCFSVANALATVPWNSSAHLSQEPCPSSLPCPGWSHCAGRLSRVLRLKSCSSKKAPPRPYCSSWSLTSSGDKWLPPRTKSANLVFVLNKVNVITESFIWKITCSLATYPL